MVTLYGALDAATQDRAIAPAPAGRRKVVLATSIAETSLTIEGVRIVVDSGLARVPRYEPGVGLTRLETVRVSRAAADQRRGRAGRTEPGICYRLWDEPETASLEPYARPEILRADLSSFALDLAQWGVDRSGNARPSSIRRRRRPIPRRRKLLVELGAIDAEGRITEEGRKLRALPLPPRLARMVVDAAREGAAGARRRYRRACSANAGSAATMSISRIGSMGSAATARAAPKTRAAWPSDGRRMRRPRQASGVDARAVAPALSSRSLIRIASPKAAAAGGAFLLANGRGARSIRPRRLRANHISWSRI